MKIIAFIGMSIALGFAAAAQAQDGKNPPDVNPLHYQCYRVSGQSPTQMLKSLKDQFGVSRPVRVLGPIFLCAPTSKNEADVKDPVTHYLCYQEQGVKAVNKSALIINQLTKSSGIKVQIGGPFALCVPSLKKI